QPRPARLRESAEDRGGRHGRTRNLAVRQFSRERRRSVLPRAGLADHAVAAGRRHAAHGVHRSRKAVPAVAAYVSENAGKSPAEVKTGALPNRPLLAALRRHMFWKRNIRLGSSIAVTIGAACHGVACLIRIKRKANKPPRTRSNTMQKPGHQRGTPGLSISK